ncbi:alpha/beta hydrolase [Microbacterium sp. CFH 31415]|nr:alpha/beta hydrolase [Microbacterium sp. CFH 31415]MCH6231244.1 alpha/beta hydrolase [Microbacterium sp. CFH 31415]
MDVTRLGHERFTVVGHDRGSYVGLRLALDHAHRLDRAVLIGDQAPGNG